MKKCRLVGLPPLSAQGVIMTKPIQLGDIVVTDSYVNATLYRILSITDNKAEIAVVKFDGADQPDGTHPLQDFFHLNTKQKEEYRERLQKYRGSTNTEPN